MYQAQSNAAPKKTPMPFAEPLRGFLWTIMSNQRSEKIVIQHPAVFPVVREKREAIAIQQRWKRSEKNPPHRTAFHALLFVPSWQATSITMFSAGISMNSPIYILIYQPYRMMLKPQSPLMNPLTENDSSPVVSNMP